MADSKIVTVAKGGTEEHRVDVSTVTVFPLDDEQLKEDPRPLHIPDLWHAARWLEKMGADYYAKQVRDAWGLLHAMVNHIREET